ncbi:unnamed protein product [Symbiodinium necroappetens]|uniref:Uncharacterized protein n=1 Tax=Symbiodinium necroappetens TaxID=1628268 RepID=A0A813AAE4_9DINO|nr:unnamed protein product [Symbiodinium necroappetens]
MEGASLNMMPYKRLQPLARLEDDVFDNVPNDSYDEVSQREELLRAVKKLNTYRWFCRLPPVLVDEDSTELCEFLNESMVSRKPVFVKESHSLTRRVSDLGDQLGGFMANSGHAMILHKAGSLISAIDVGILCSHTGGWSYSSAPAPGAASEAAAAGQSAQDEILSRGQLHGRGNTARERPKPGLAAWSLQAATEVQPVCVQNLPDSLAGYRTMWEILDKLGGGIKQDGCNAPSRASRGKSLRMPRLAFALSQLATARSALLPGRHDQAKGSKAFKSFAMRFRLQVEGAHGSSVKILRFPPHCLPFRGSQLEWQVFWGSNETARRREWSRASNLSWGDRTNTVTLRRQLLSPRLQNFGASRLRETCVIRTSPGTGETAEDEEEWAKRDETDFVVFPPYGVCPLELLGGHALPTWTIMPNSHRFQPTHALQVRMWRVKLLRGEEDIGWQHAVESAGPFPDSQKHWIRSCSGCMCS